MTSRRKCPMNVAKLSNDAISGFLSVSDFTENILDTPCNRSKCQQKPKPRKKRNKR